MTDAVIEKITQGLQRAIGEDCGLGALLKLRFDNGGVILVDARQKPNKVTNDDCDADCTLTLSLDTFNRLLSGQLDGTEAFLSGKLRVSGDMSVAARVNPILQRR